jgi:hypothetical protein
MFHGRGYPARCFLEVAVGSVERSEWATRSAPWKVRLLSLRRRFIPAAQAHRILLSPDLFRPTNAGEPAGEPDLHRYA